MERRITNTVGTIPDNVAISGTTVTSQTDTTVLISSGTDNLNDIIYPGGTGLYANYWAYVPDASPKIAQIQGIYQISFDANTGIYVFSIQLDRYMTGASSSALFYVQRAVAFSYVNDGGANGSIGDGATQVTVEDGEGGTYLAYEKYSNRPQMQPVRYIVATGTSFFIQEEL